MAMTPEQERQNFWGQLGTGLFNVGTGLYGQRATQKENDKYMQMAQGPLYQQQMAGAQTALNQAGNFDPVAHANERFQQAQGMLAGKDAASYAQLMRDLHAKGQMGMANYNPGIEGIDPGTRMNPQMAAYFAAQNARDRRMAYDSLNEGETLLNSRVNRAGTLQQQANNTQQSGFNANDRRGSPASASSRILSGLGGVLGNTGLLGSGLSWLTNQTRNLFSGGNSILPTGGFEAGFGDWWN